jgi:hypothetical protein
MPRLERRPRNGDNALANNKLQQKVENMLACHPSCYRMFVRTEDQ